MQRHSMRALARLSVTLQSLPLLAKAVALLITLSVIGHIAGYPTIAGGLATAAALLAINAGIDKAMAGSNGHE